MSYGNPCSSRTGRPFAGPSSTYPWLSTPASICRTGPNPCRSGVPARAAVAPPISGPAPAARAATPLVRKNFRRSPKFSMTASLVDGGRAAHTLTPPHPAGNQENSLAPGGETHWFVSRAGHVRDVDDTGNVGILAR